MRRQPTLGIGIRRIPGHSSFEQAIQQRVERDALRFDCSKAWVISTIVGEHYRLDVPRFDEAPKKGRK